VFRVTSAGTPGTVFDATEDEIRALVIGPDGALYAAGLSASAVGNDEDDEPAARPAPVTSAVSGGRATIYRIVPDSLVQSWWTSAEPFVFALASTPGGVVAATGNRAGLYRIERLQGASRWLSSSEGQVTALAADRDGVLYAATSNPGALWIVGRERGAKGDIRSPALDARRIASFGRLVWRGEARGSRVRLSARSGNSDPPDTTWSEWQGGETGPEGRALSVPPARYFQWKVELEGGDGRLDAIMASWRERNLPPRLTDFVVAPQGTSFREGEITPRTENVTQTLPGGQKVEFSLPSSPTPRALRALPMWTRGLRTLQWKGSDPNGDELTYRVDVRREPAGAWISVGKELDATSFTWDTNALPDGRYRLRVMVSDAKSNAVGEDAADSTFSEPFIVDNTAPEIGAFTAGGEAGGIAIEGRASDATSPLSRLEIAVDDEDWIPLSPSDGLADGLEESFRARVPAPAGERTIGLRVVDLAGNSTVRSLPVSVPRAR
jgi:hypothetical protein